MAPSKRQKRSSASSSSSSSSKKRSLEEEEEEEDVKEEDPPALDEDQLGKAAEDASDEDDDDDRTSPRSVVDSAVTGQTANEEAGEEGADEDAADDEVEDGKDDVEEDEDEDEDEEEDEQEEDDGGDNSGNRNPLRRRSTNKEGRPPEAGVIDEVYCENFMCHQKLRVSFCRNVNFIHGQNGSGKSAILAAIQICLGAGARRTHRARNLKDLIKKDTDRAKVRVTLLNGGDDAYKHDVYGDKVIVERCITMGSGYNGYKLLDAKGVEKSRSKKDLDEMLDQLNVQVENPVSVLDQEESKKFLTGKPEDKYNFFLKATELERIDRSYCSTQETMEEMQDTQRKLDEALHKVKEDTRTLKKKWEQHQDLEKIQSAIRKDQVKLSWAHYTEALNDFEHAQKQSEAFEAKAAKKREELSQAEEALSQPQEEGQRRQNRIDELVKEAEEQSNRKYQLDEEYKKAFAPYREVERQLGHVKRQRQQAAQKVKAAKRRLQEARNERNRQAGSAESEQARKTAELEAMEKDFDDRRDRMDELRESVSASLRAFEEVEPHVKDAKNKADLAQRRLGAMQQTVRSLQQNSDEFALLGRNVRKVYDAVEKARSKFQGKVVGPVGKYVKIEPDKQSFAEIAELAIGNGILDCFLVTNDHDRLIMNEIRKRNGCGRDCAVVQVKEAPRYSVPGPPVPGIETVASVLKIDDDLVFNVLVDLAQIESKALGTGLDESQNALLEERGGKYSIKGGIKEVYFLPKGDQWNVRNGNLGIISNTKRMTPTIGVDKSQALARAQREAEEAKAEVDQLNAEANQKEGEHSKLQRAWTKARKELQNNETQMARLSSQIEDLRADIETTADSPTIDLTEHEQDVAQEEEDEAKIKELEDKLAEELKSRKPEIDKIQEQRDEVTMRLDRIEQDVSRASEELTQYLETQSQNEAAIEKKRKKLEKLEEVRDKHKEHVKMKEEEMKSKLGVARLLYYRVQERLRREKNREEGANEEDLDDDDKDPSPEELEQIEPMKTDKGIEYYIEKIRKNERKMENERQRRKMTNEDPQVAYEKYIRALELENSKREQLDLLTSQIEQISEDLEDRRAKWNRMRKHLDTMTRLKFGELLELNNYQGKLRYDHRDKRLDIIVKKESEANKVEATDVKGLSGGERSFTTLCLLLALGEKLETPFRVLDEFDVFLDTASRRLTMQLLIFTAKRMTHRQFIFITPQDISGLKADPLVRIHKLLPPERHQMAGFTQTNLA